MIFFLLKSSGFVCGVCGGILAVCCVVFWVMIVTVEVSFFALWRIVSSLSFVSFLCGLCQMGLLDRVENITLLSYSHLPSQTSSHPPRHMRTRLYQKRSVG